MVVLSETSSLRGSSAPRRQHIVALPLLVSSLAVVGCACLLWHTSGNGPVELEWRALAPGAVHSVTPKVTSAVQHKSKANGPHLSNLEHLFGIQHFPGHGLATSHVVPLVPSLKKAPRTQELTDGYMDAAAYLQRLDAEEHQQQADHMKKWKAKNLKAGKKMVKDAAALYKKWVMVDPDTGISKPNLQIPTAIRARSLARKQMMMQVEGADDGKTYTLPWFCIGVHPEADGSGVGWDGAKAPMGPHGTRGVDCTPPWLKASPAATQLLAEVGGRWVPVQGLAEEEVGEEETPGAEEPIGDMINALGGEEEEGEAEKEAAEEEEKEEAGADEQPEERKELGDEVFEVDQGDGDVMIKADTLMPWMFGGQ